MSARSRTVGPGFDFTEAINLADHSGKGLRKVEAELWVLVEVATNRAQVFRKRASASN
jgi:hypothetical protein